MSYQEAPIGPLYALVRGSMLLYEKHKHDLRVKGLGNFPMRGAVILVPSHREASDPWVAAVSVARPAYFMSKKELWTSRYKYFGFLMGMLGAFPIDRDNPQLSSFKKAHRVVEQGMVLGVFGEGSRYEDETLKIVRGDQIGSLHDSFARVAVKHCAPVVAMGISTMNKEEIEEAGREVKRVVLTPVLRTDSNLPNKVAQRDLLSRTQEALQTAFDEANEAARIEAYYS
ncbi:MAG: lysophospholipid acyltransferase family protein [Patescibacteria group bacterium]